MKITAMSSLQRFWLTEVSRSRKILLISALGLGTGLLATPTNGIVLNAILAKGVVLGNVHQEILREGRRSPHEGGSLRN